MTKIKHGTTTSKAAAGMVSASKGVRKGGNSHKNVRATRTPKPHPSGPTAPLKGPDRGGV